MLIDDEDDEVVFQKEALHKVHVPLPFTTANTSVLSAFVKLAYFPIITHPTNGRWLVKDFTDSVALLLLACGKSHMLSASRRQPHLLHVSAVDRRQTWVAFLLNHGRKRFLDGNRAKTKAVFDLAKPKPVPVWFLRFYPFDYTNWNRFLETNEIVS